MRFCYLPVDTLLKLLLQCAPIQKYLWENKELICDIISKTLYHVICNVRIITKLLKYTHQTDKSCLSIRQYSIWDNFVSSTSALRSTFTTLMLYLTHWDRDKMADISQTTYSNALSWMKMFEFRKQFDWGLFLRIQVTIIQYCLKQWLGAEQTTVMASVGWPQLIDTVWYRTSLHRHPNARKIQYACLWWRCTAPNW